MKTCIDCGWPLPCDCEPERSAGSLERVVRGIIVEWENEANLLKAETTPPNVPRTQVLQEECALRGCIADIKRVLDASNNRI